MNVQKEGWLWKIGKNLKMNISGKRLWFVLEGKSMTYYDNRAAKSPKGSVSLVNCTVESFDPLKSKVNLDSFKKECGITSNLCFFSLKTPKKTYILGGNLQVEAEEWIAALSSAGVANRNVFATTIPNPTIATASADNMSPASKSRLSLFGTLRRNQGQSSPAITRNGSSPPSPNSSDEKKKQRLSTFIDSIISKPKEKQAEDDNNSNNSNNSNHQETKVKISNQAIEDKSKSKGTMGGDKSTKSRTKSSLSSSVASFLKVGEEESHAHNSPPQAKTQDKTQQDTVTEENFDHRDFFSLMVLAEKNSKPATNQ